MFYSFLNNGEFIVLYCQLNSLLPRTYLKKKKIFKDETYFLYWSGPTNLK